MKLVFISDTHSLENRMKYKIPECDVLCISGDITNKGDYWDIVNFTNWLDEEASQARYKVVIAGNHDFCFETPSHFTTYANPMRKEGQLAKASREKLEEIEGLYYLMDEEVKIDGVTFYGSPWQPEFFSWAFNLPRNGPDLEEKWSRIPSYTDVLLTHGPPQGILDLTKRDNMRAGCEKLRSRLNKISPKIHAFGHIHEGYGTQMCGETLFINASVCTLGYQPINIPIVVNLEDGVTNVIEEEILR